MNAGLGEAPYKTDEAVASSTLHSQQNRGRMLLLESILIVGSVLLGFGLQAWGERRADRRTAQAVLENFRVEIETNLSQLERVQPEHAQFAERLAEAIADSVSNSAETGFDVFVRTMPEDGFHTPLLREAAWETAVSTGALSLLDYDLAAVLSEIYLAQRSTLGPTFLRFQETLYTPANVDSRQREALVRVHQMMVNEVVGQEAYLIDVYRNALERLSEAGR